MKRSTQGFLLVGGLGVLAVIARRPTSLPSGITSSQRSVLDAARNVIEDLLDLADDDGGLIVN